MDENIFIGHKDTSFIWLIEELMTIIVLRPAKPLQSSSQGIGSNQPTTGSWGRMGRMKSFVLLSIQVSIHLWPLCLGFIESLFSHTCDSSRSYIWLIYRNLWTLLWVCLWKCNTYKEHCLPKQELLEFHEKIDQVWKQDEVKIFKGNGICV